MWINYLEGLQLRIRNKRYNIKFNTAGTVGIQACGNASDGGTKN